MFDRADFKTLALNGTRGIARKGHHKIEPVGHEFIQDMGRMDAHINADFFHDLVDELIGHAAIDADRTGKNPAGKSLARQRRCHGRAHRIHGTDKEHTGQFALGFIDAAGIGLHGADQGEQAPCGVEIDHQLVVEPGAQQFGGIVVHAAPGHVHGFDLKGLRRADGFVIAVANAEIVADEAAKRGQRQVVGSDRLKGFRVADIKDDEVADNRHMERKWPLGVDPGGAEAIVFKQIIDGDAPLMHLVGIDRGDGVGVKRHGDEAVGVGRSCGSGHGDAQ